jgi:hypothetical protein
MNTSRQQGVFSSRNFRNILGVVGLIVYFITTCKLISQTTREDNNKWNLITAARDRSHSAAAVRERRTKAISSHSGLLLLPDNENVPKDESAAEEDDASRDNKKKPVFIMHIGPRKTGTTTIQCSLPKLLLEEDGFLFLGKVSDCYILYKELQKKKDFINIDDLSYFFIKHFSNNETYCDDTCLQTLRTEHFSRKLIQVLDNAKQRGLDVVMSDEGYMDQLAGIPAFREVLKGWHVKVVGVYRRYYQWVPSSYNSKHKPLWKRKDRAALHQWPGVEKGETIPTLSNVLAGTLAEDDRKAPWGEFVLEKIHTMASIYPDVTVINMHDPNGLLHKFVCDVMQANHSCKALQGNGFLSKSRNPSRPLHHDRIAVAAYKAGLFNRSFDRTNVRKAIRKRDQVDLGNDSISGYPLVCLSPTQQAELLDQSLRYERQLFPEFFKSPEGEESLRADFASSKRQLALCNVDAEQVVQDQAWQDFFRTLKFEDEDA